MTPDEVNAWTGKPLAVRINRLRAERGIEQRLLAEHMGISVRTLEDKFLGRRKFSVADVMLLASVLNVTIDDLVSMD